MSRRGWCPIMHQGGWRSCLECGQGWGQFRRRDEEGPSERPDCGQLGSEGRSHALGWDEDQPEATEGMCVLGSRYRASRDSAEKSRWGGRWGPGQILDLSPIWWTRWALMSQWVVCTPHSEKLYWEPGVLSLDLGPVVPAGPWLSRSNTCHLAPHLGHLGAGEGSVLEVTLCGQLLPVMGVPPRFSRGRTRPFLLSSRGP